MGTRNICVRCGRIWKPPCKCWSWWEKLTWKIESWWKESKTYNLSRLRTQNMKCQRCNIREATTPFAHDETAAIHGWTIQVCEHCSLSIQLEHARQQANRIPELELKLKLLERKENEL